MEDEGGVGQQARGLSDVGLLGRAPQSREPVLDDLAGSLAAEAAGAHTRHIKHEKIPVDEREDGMAGGNAVGGCFHKNSMVGEQWIGMRDASGVEEFPFMG